MNETGPVDGVVRVWNEDEGIGVVDTAQTPGGCFVHFSSVEMDGFRELRQGQHVRLYFEPALNQDGYLFRATRVRPID